MIEEVSAEKRAAHAAAVAAAPPEIRKVAERFDVFARYRMIDTEQIVRIDNFYVNDDDEVRLTVWIDPDYNPPSPRNGFGVFGIDPNLLKPWPPLKD